MLQCKYGLYFFGASYRIISIVGNFARLPSTVLTCTYGKRYSFQLEKEICREAKGIQKISAQGG